LSIYWFLFAYFAVGAIIAGSFRSEANRQPSILFTAGAIIMAVLIGLRYQVGGDWLTYQFIYERAGPLDFFDAMSIGDPGYQAVNWLAYQLGGQVWLVNSICAAIFVWGLFRFCRTQPMPWLTVLVAIPYMVIVVAMGYTRQAVALGILMAGVAAFIRNPSPFLFGIYVVAAALFHRTAVVAFPVVALATERNRIINLLVVITAAYFLYDMFLGNAMDHFVDNYIRARYSSQGAAIRVAMNMVAAGTFWLVGRNRLKFTQLEWNLWRNFSIASVISLILLIIVPSSTAVDRMSLYLIPLQVAVLARVPMAFKSDLFGTVVIAGYCFIVELVWLNFAQFANLWVPYRFFPI
jgi:EpsG family